MESDGERLSPGDIKRGGRKAHRLCTRENKRVVESARIRNKGCGSNVHGEGADKRDRNEEGDV